MKEAIKFKFVPKVCDGVGDGPVRLEVFSETTPRFRCEIEASIFKDARLTEVHLRDLFWMGREPDNSGEILREVLEQTVAWMTRATLLAIGVDDPSDEKWKPLWSVKGTVH